MPLLAVARAQSLSSSHGEQGCGHCWQPWRGLLLLPAFLIFVAWKTAGFHIRDVRIPLPFPDQGYKHLLKVKCIPKSERRQRPLSF